MIKEGNSNVGKRMLNWAISVCGETKIEGQRDKREALRGKEARRKLTYTATEPLKRKD